MAPCVAAAVAGAVAPRATGPPIALTVAAGTVPAGKAPSPPDGRAPFTAPTGAVGALSNQAEEAAMTSTIGTLDRATVVFRRNRDRVAWSALDAAGGRILRTHAGQTTVLATVGPQVKQVRDVVAAADLSPATFLHPLAVATAGTAVDMPRLVRAALAGRTDEVPACQTTGDLARVGAILEAAKPGARAAVVDAITATLDLAGPFLVPAQVTWFVGEDHHARRADVDLSMALAVMGADEVTWMREVLAGGKPAGLSELAISCLSDWDSSLREDMTYADLETVEVVPAEATIVALTAILDREHPAWRD